MALPTDAPLGLKQVLAGATAKYGLSPSTVGHVLGTTAAPTVPKPPQPQDFVTSVLKGVGAPVNPNTTQALKDWIAAEGGGPDNPLNTTYGQSGAQGSGIKGYGSVPAGINATVKTLQNGLYSNVISAFKSGNPTAIRRAVVNSPWDVNHYQGTDYRAVLGSAALPAASRPQGQTKKMMSSNMAPSVPGASDPGLLASSPTDSSTPTETQAQAITADLLRSGGGGLSISQLLRDSSLPVNLSSPAITTSPTTPTIRAPSGMAASGRPAGGALPIPTQGFAGGTRQTAPTSGVGYQNLFGQASGVHASRVDQGVDYYGIHGPVGAVDSGTIVEILPASQTAGAGVTIVQRLANGHFVYYGLETGAAVKPGLQPGKKVAAGEQIATGIPSGGLEIGFAQSGQGFLPLTPATGSHDIATPGGAQFARYLAGPVHIHRTPNGQVIPYRTAA